MAIMILIIGEVLRDRNIWDEWIYLGNFNKSNLFKTIYDILNGND